MIAFFALALSLPPALFDAPTLRGAHVSLYAVSTDGSELAARNPDDAMIPASNLKLIVGSAALDLLGPSFAFVTTMERDGSTLYLRGGGDPLLDTHAIADAAATLQRDGMTHISRLIDDSPPSGNERYPDGWQQDDLPYDYAAPPATLGFDENAVHVHVAPRAPGQPVLVTVDPPQNSITIRSVAVTGAAGSDDTLALHVDWSAPQTLVLDGSIPAGATPDEIDASVLDPAAFALDQTARALRAAGIAVDELARGSAPSSATLVWQHRSEALPALLRDMWQPSDNLLAESLLDALGNGSRERGLAAEQTWLERIGVDPSTVSLSDASGLSAYDRVTARDLVTILLHDWNAPYRDTVLAALPVAGQSGTLAHAFAGTPLAGNVIAKTGTVDHTRTLSGYLRTPRGTIIFSLLVNDWLDRSPEAAAHLRAFQSDVLEALF